MWYAAFFIEILAIYILALIICLIVSSSYFNIGKLIIFWIPSLIYKVKSQISKALYSKTLTIVTLYFLSLSTLSFSSIDEIIKYKVVSMIFWRLKSKNYSIFYV